MELLDPLFDPQSSYVSTGSLPPSDHVARLVTQAHERFASVALGQNSQVYPALAHVPSNLFGICVVSVDGRVFAVGDAEHEFTLMSVSKPFIFALICDVIGATGARERLGVNATGYAFTPLPGPSATRRAAAIRWSMPEPSPRRPGAGRDRGSEMALHQRGPVSLCRKAAVRQR